MFSRIFEKKKKKHSTLSDQMYLGGNNIPVQQTHTVCVQNITVNKVINYMA